MGYQTLISRQAKKLGPHQLEPTFTRRRVPLFDQLGRIKHETSNHFPPHRSVRSAIPGCGLGQTSHCDLQRSLRPSRRWVRVTTCWSRKTRMFTRSTLRHHYMRLLWRSAGYQITVWVTYPVRYGWGLLLLRTLFPGTQAEEGNTIMLLR